MKTKSLELYNQFRSRLSHYSNESLVNLFNSEVTQRGWGSARAALLEALHQEFIERDFDFSAIGNKNCLSLKTEVRIVGRVVIMVV